LFAEAAVLAASAEVEAVAPDSFVEQAPSTSALHSTTKANGSLNMVKVQLYFNQRN
jgi:hypothetical protein